MNAGLTSAQNSNTAVCQYLEVLLLEFVYLHTVQQRADRRDINIQLGMLHQLWTSICVHNPCQDGHILISFQPILYHFLQLQQTRSSELKLICYWCLLALIYLYHSHCLLYVTTHFNCTGYSTLLYSRGCGFKSSPKTGSLQHFS